MILSLATTTIKNIACAFILHMKSKKEYHLQKYEYYI